MPKHLLLFLLLLIITDGRAQKPGVDAYGFPTVERVAEHISWYLPELTNEIDYRRYTLAKKTDGWYIRTEKYVDVDFQLIDSRLCWSAAKGDYTVNSETNNPDDAAKIKRAILSSSLQAYDFRRLPMYGYRGWVDDVISAYADSAHLIDLHMEALARAYSSRALYASGQWADFASSDPPVRSNNGGMLTRAQADTLRKYEHLSNEVYRRLAIQNPYYETLVGDAYLKYCDEVVSTYLSLAFQYDMTEAKMELKPGLFSDLYISFAKNMLNSCGKNGILITQGDNDTYPLYYVQEQLGIRRDVLVVNSSLLALSTYINFLRRGIYDAPPLPVTIDSADYTGDQMDIVRFTEPRYDDLIKATGLDFRPEVKTLLKNDVFFLHTIAVNKWKRPIYIAMTAAPDVALNMDKYFRSEGMAYRLTKKASDNTQLISAPVNTDFSYPFLMNNFASTDWTKTPVIDEGVRRMVWNYAGLFSKVAKALADDKKYDACLKVLDKYRKEFPEEKFPYGLYCCEMPGLYIKSGRIADGKAMALKMINAANKNYQLHIDDYPNVEFQDWQRSMQDCLYILQTLQPLVREHMAEDGYADRYDADFTAKKEKWAEIVVRIGQ